MFEFAKALAETTKEIPKMAQEKLNPKFLESGENNEKGKLNPKFMDNIAEVEKGTDIRGLDADEKNTIKNETGWSNEIIDSIESMEEYAIYKNAGLKEIEINDRKCLVRDDINMEQKFKIGVDDNGNDIYKSNEELIADGNSPRNKDGKTIELHHVGQKENSPLAELTPAEHRQNGNDLVLHDKTKQTEVHGEGNRWQSQKGEYWKSRVEERI